MKIGRLVPTHVVVGKAACLAVATQARDVSESRRALLLLPVRDIGGAQGGLGPGQVLLDAGDLRLGGAD